MKKKTLVFSFLLVGLFTIIGASTSFAAEEGPLKAPQGVYYWEITDVSGYYTTYGGWDFCASGTGDAGEYVTCRTTLSVGNTYSGSLEVGIDEVSASVGFDTSTSFSQTTSYRADIDYDGETVYIDVRDVYRAKNVDQTYYHDYGYTRFEVDSATVVAKNWDGFDYRSR